MEDIKKCSFENHSEIDAVSYCVECDVFMCNKCLNQHEFLKKHHKYNINKNFDELFIGICKEKNHKNELEYFCKDHNQLCCVACISKIKGYGNGQHSDCNICHINDIKEEKKNKLNENIKNLEELSNIIEDSIKKLKIIITEINNNKEQLKIEIIKKFTQIRNSINEREDKLLAQIDNKYNEIFLKEDDNIIKKSEKLPNIIKISLEKGKLINEKWNNNENKLNSNINDCLQIENSIKTINTLNENIEKYNNQKIKLKFEDINDNLNIIIKNINEFGDIINDYEVYKFKFKKGKNYILNENCSIATKNEGGNDYNCTIIGDKEIPKNKISRWKIKLNKIYNNDSNNIFIGIGPDNPNNKNNFYENCWMIVCGNSKLLNRCGNYSDYNGHSERFKEGDVLEIIADRIKGQLSFVVNGINFGVAFTNIPKEDSLYPVIIMQYQNQTIELI